MAKGTDKIRPLVSEMTRILMKAYEKGLFVGIELGEKLNSKEK